MNDSVIDEEKLQMLRDLSEGNDDLLLQLFDSYIPLAETEIESIASLSDPSDIEQLRERLHSIKGATANLGLNGMLDIIAALQDEVKTGDYSQFSDRVTQMREALDQVRSFRGRLG